MHKKSIMKPWRYVIPIFSHNLLPTERHLDGGGGLGVEAISNFPTSQQKTIIEESLAINVHFRLHYLSIPTTTTICDFHINSRPDKNPYSKDPFISYWFTSLITLRLGRPPRWLKRIGIMMPMSRAPRWWRTAKDTTTERNGMSMRGKYIEKGFCILSNPQTLNKTHISQDFTFINPHNMCGDDGMYGKFSFMCCCCWVPPLSCRN